MKKLDSTVKSLRAISRELGLTLHEQVRRHLRTLLENNFADGERFFSERELIDQLNVSQPTVRRALADLAVEGLLHRGVGRGTFVRKSVRDRSVGIFVPKIDSFLQLATVSTLGNLCAEADIGFHLYHLRPGKPMSEACEVLKRSPREERILFNGTTTDDTWNLYHELGKRGYRSLYIGSTEGYPGSSVSTDHQLGAELAMSHLTSLGHERIAFIVNEPIFLQSIQIRLDTIRRIVERDKMQHITFHDCNTPAWGDSFAAAYDKMEEVLALSPRPTAICPLSGSGCWGALRYLNKIGINVPKEISLFAFDDSPFSQQIYPSLTSLSSSPESEQLCLSILWGDHADVQKALVRPQLIVRESTGPARPIL